MEEVKVPTSHHPFCNYWNKPIEECKGCKDFYEKYPWNDGDDVDAMVKKHFPNVVFRENKQNKENKE